MPLTYLHTELKPVWLLIKQGCSRLYIKAQTGYDDDTINHMIREIKQLYVIKGPALEALKKFEGKATRPPAQYSNKTVDQLINQYIQQ